MNDLYSIEVNDIYHQPILLKRYKNRVMLIVNVASKCGFTPQYNALESLYKKYEEKGLSILAFPCNQFLSQEPLDEIEIQQFCSINFGVTFDLFEKIDVNGTNTHPLYQHLKQFPNGIFGPAIKWNFTKFLIDREGKIIQRYAPNVDPKDIEKDIKKLLLLP